MSSLLGLERQQRRFLKIHFEFAYFSFFLGHLELNWYTPGSSLENHTRFQTKTQQNPALLFGVVYTYMAYIGEYPPGP